MTIKALIRSDLKDFQSYPSAKKQNLTGHIWLNANESPWNHALAQYPEVWLNRYPEPQPSKLLEKLADMYQTRTKNILITAGSDSAIDLLVRLFCAPYTDRILSCPPTFSMYETCGRLQGVTTVSVPLDKEKGFQLNVSAIKKAQAKLIFLCSPNNPTGNCLNEADILEICQAYLGKGLVIVDEAYIEYAHCPSLIAHLLKHENLIILRTFSKAWGLAGIRCGMLVAHEEIIEWLNKIMLPYPISGLVAQIALNALQNTAFSSTHAGRIQLIQAERERLASYLSNHPLIEKVWPSQANFLLLETRHANDLMASFLQNGIVTRLLNNRTIRVSIGIPEENDRLINVLKNLGG